MPQYFDNDPSILSKEKKICYEICGKQFALITDNGVFSKDKIDEGSYAFLKVLLPLHLSGKVLDLGSGYGAIGLTIASFEPSIHITLVDVNLRALDLANKNAHLLGLSQRVTILQSNIFENVEGPFDSIVVNPPIRAGKIVTYKMYEESKQYLISGGSLYVVIRKDQGAPSASRYINDLYGNITLLKKDKGYYIYRAIKD